MTIESSLAAALAGRYELLRELGRGGMATVYLADDLRHRRKVAVKVLHSDLSAVIGPERFLKEIELTANLQHPHILSLFDSGEAAGQLYYVMPYIDGESLRARLDREQQLSVRDAVRIASEVADALDYAHRRGIIHRDIKPENVLLHDGHALVADFGIALAVQQAGQGRLTQTGLSLGTPYYMAPEQAMGERTIDARADIYALGGVTYEMLAGEPPFTGPNAQAILARAMTERPRSLIAIRDTLPPAVDRAVQVALAKLPADRFDTASEFASALTSDSTVAGVKTGPQRRSWIPLATLAAGLVAGAAAVFALRPRGTAAGDPQFWSVTLPADARLELGHDYYDALLRSVDISPDGKTIVWSTTTDGVPWLWQARTDVGTQSRIEGTKGAALPTFSPDGRYLAFAVDSVVQKIELANGTVSTVGTFGVIEAMLWPTAEKILGYFNQNCLRAASANGGQFLRVVSKDCTGIDGGITVPRDGSSAVSAIGEGLFVMDMKSGKVRPIRRAGAADSSSASSFVEGTAPMLVANGVLLFMRDSTLYAAHIDRGKARLTDEPRAILGGVRREAFAGTAQAALSANGTFVWVSGADAAISRFVFASPGTATVDTVPISPSNVASLALSHDGQRIAYSVYHTGGSSVLRVFDRRRGVQDTIAFPFPTQVEAWMGGDSGVTISKSGGYFAVRINGSAMTVDSAGRGYMSTSEDGAMRCSRAGFFWRASAPADTVVFARDPDWCRFSPDGRTISWNDGEGLFVAPATRDAASARRKIAAVGADEAYWTRDGNSLVYRNGFNWFSVPAQPTVDGRVAPPHRVFGGRYNQARGSWALAPDGRMLLLQTAPMPAGDHLNVITNFPRYVEQKLKRRGSN